MSDAAPPGRKMGALKPEPAKLGLVWQGSKEQGSAKDRWGDKRSKYFMMNPTKVLMAGWKISYNFFGRK